MSYLNASPSTSEAVQVISVDWPSVCPEAGEVIWTVGAFTENTRLASSLPPLRKAIFFVPSGKGRLNENGTLATTPASGKLKTRSNVKRCRLAPAAPVKSKA